MPQLRRILFWLFCITAFAVSVNFFIKANRQVESAGGTDLRARVVGSRLLVNNRSPYFYKWKAEDGEYFLDPNRSATRMVNGNIVTPAVLLVIYPIASLRYDGVRHAWFFLEVIAAISTILLCFKGFWKELQFEPFILIAGFVCTDLFLFHLDRGQMYIFYALLFSIIYRLFSIYDKKRQFWCGLLMAFFFFLRPFAGIVILPFVLAWKPQVIYGWLTGMIVAIIIVVIPFWYAWNEYFLAMDIYVQETLGSIISSADHQDLFQGNSIEGVGNMSEGLHFKSKCINSLCYYLRIAGYKLSPQWYYVVYAAIITILSAGFLLRTRTNYNAVHLFLFAFIVYILAELILVNKRADYNAMQWLFPCCLLMISCKKHKLLYVLMLLITLQWQHLPWRFFYQYWLSEAGLFLMCMYIVFRETELSRFHKKALDAPIH